MLTQLCQYLRNWFERDIFYGSFTIADGVLTYEDGTPLPLLTGQYYRIVGSVFSDVKAGEGAFIPIMGT